MLVEGVPQVRIHGEKIAVHAAVHILGGFSAHAGQTYLLIWFAAIAPSRPRVVVTHGDHDARQALAKLIRQNHGLNSVLPAMGEWITL